MKEQIKYETYTYRIPCYSLAYFINGDKDGYTDEELQKFQQFEKKLIKAHGNANICLMDEEERNQSFYWSNDLENIGADCETVAVMEQIIEEPNAPILTSEGQPFKTDGYLTICNSGGIEIMLNRSQDGVYYLFTGDTEPEESEIQHDQEGEPYFLINTTAYYLNQFIKINL